jgi:intracellular sulfur oxidation DsrE/DsrF family protein
MLVLSTPLAAEAPQTGPVIEAYGPTVMVGDLDVPLADGFEYRVAFDLAEYSGEKTALNHGLASVARFLNMHARNGVPVGKMAIAVVIHGTALENALSHEAYALRHDVQNPNLDLLMQLHTAGVAFYACGQSLVFGGIPKSDLASPVKVALSAMTMMAVLQSDGYALIP